VNDWYCFGHDGDSFLGRDPKRKSDHLGLWRFDGTLLRDCRWMEDWCLNEPAMSADGRFLAAGEFGADYYAFLVDLRANPPAERKVHHTHTVQSVAWSPTAPLLAANATRSVWLWDALTDQPGRKLGSFGKTVEGLVFSPDGKLLLAGSRDGRARLWETDSGRERADVDWQVGKVNDVAFAPDGSTAAAAGSRGVVVWDLD
jgi:WD40 repeat protein